MVLSCTKDGECDTSFDKVAMVGETEEPQSHLEWRSCFCLRKEHCHLWTSARSRPTLLSHTDLCVDID